MPDADWRPRILIVDESRMARATLIKRVRDHYNFREEVDGEAGWQALVLDHSIQLVICSLSMPILDGDGLLARIRSSKLARIRQLPVLIIAGDDEEANARARALGASDFVGRAAGSSELLTRIATLLQIVQMQSELAQGGEHQLRDQEDGLMTRQQVEIRAARALAEALRQDSPVSVLVMSFDRYAALREEHGSEVLARLQKRLASMLAQKVRREDILGHFSESELVVVSPGTPHPACEAFANRLREAFAVANIALHGQRLQLLISVGVVNTPVDRVGSAAEMLELAADRLRTAQLAGGNRVLACADKASAGAPAPRLSHALDLIRTGHADVVVPHLAGLVNEILPFLDLLDRELKLDLPLAGIRKRLLDREQAVKDTRQA